MYHSIEYPFPTPPPCTIANHPGGELMFVGTCGRKSSSGAASHAYHSVPIVVSPLLWSTPV